MSPRIALACLLLTCALGACGDSDAPAGPAPSERAFNPSDDVAAARFAERIAQLLNTGDANALTALFDRSALRQIAFGETRLPEDLTVGAVNGLVENYARSLASAGGRYRAVRAGAFDGGPRCVVRALLPNGSCNYLEFYIAAKDAPNFKIRDMASAVLGGRVSDALRLSTSLMLQNGGGPLLQSLFDLPSVDDALLAQVKGFVEAALSGDSARARTLHAQLPERLQDEWIFTLHLLNACSASGDEGAYRSALREAATRFRATPQAQVMLIDFYLFERDYPTALASIGQMITQYGEDAHLVALLATTSGLAGDIAAAKALAEKACALEPDLASSWDTRGSLAVARDDFATAAESFAKFEQVSGLTIDETQLGALDERHARFLASPEAAQWLAARSAWLGVPVAPAPGAGAR